MKNNPRKKARISLRTKVASVFGLTILAVVFFAFPSITLARGQENNLKIPGLDNLPFNKGQLQKLFQDCGNNGNDGDNGNDEDNGNDPSNTNNTDCGTSLFDIQAFHQQLQQFLKGIITDIQADSSNSDPSNTNSPFDAQAFQQQLQQLLSEICTDIGNSNCASSNVSQKTLRLNTPPTQQSIFKVVGEFEQLGQPFGLKRTSPQTRANAPITIVKVKSLKDLQLGTFIAGTDAAGNTFTGQITSPNQSPVKKAIGLINGRGQPQIVILTL